MSIVAIWLAYAILATPVFAGFFLWAIRAGQFRRQDEACHLALEAAPPIPVAAPPGRVSMAAVVPLALVGVVLVMMALAVWVSAAHGGQGAFDAGA